MELQELIENAWDNKTLLKEESTTKAIENVIDLLDKGEIRIAEKETSEGLAMHEKLGKEFDEKYRTKDGKPTIEGMHT